MNAQAVEEDKRGNLLHLRLRTHVQHGNGKAGWNLRYAKVERLQRTRKQDRDKFVVLELPLTILQAHVMKNGEGGNCTQLQRAVTYRHHPRVCSQCGGDHRCH